MLGNSHSHLLRSTGPVSAEPVSASEPDWSRETCRRFWDPSRRLLRSIRKYQAWSQSSVAPLRWLAMRRWSLSHRFWSIVCACDIPLNCQLGGGLLIPHPNGVVIHPTAMIGPNCLLLQQTTVVEKVVLGGDVNVNAGAKIVRTVTIGDHAQIGANAVVLADIPTGAIAVGVPARVVEGTLPAARWEEAS